MTLQKFNKVGLVSLGKFDRGVLPSLRKLSIVATILSCALLSGCFSSRHTVGDGPRGGEVRSHTTYYALYGFVPINAVDTRDLIGPADHYRMSTSFGLVDTLFNIFCGPLGFYRQSTVVEK